MLNLESLKQRLINSLERETTDSLNEWIKSETTKEDIYKKSLEIADRVLKEMPKEELDKIKKEVEAKGFGGPTFDEYLYLLDREFTLE